MSPTLQIMTSPKDGSWLCAEGPYLEYISQLCALNPGLKSPDTEKRYTPLLNSNAKVILLELMQDGKSVRTGIQDAAHLRLHIAKRQRGTANHIFRRIYLVEGLDPNIIEALGTGFRMDPSIFVDQERASSSSRLADGVNHAPTLPSALNPKKSFTIKYYEVRRLLSPIDDFRVSCAETGRHVKMNRFNGNFEPVGIVRRRCSYWSQSDNFGGWDGK